MTNKFAKYAPNVWLAQTEQQFNNGDEIIMTNKYGKEKPYLIHNLVIPKEKAKDKVSNYYSITPIEDMNYFERRAERMRNAVENSMKKSDAYYQKSQNGSDFLSLGEPIKIGHHSEKRHRKLIEGNHNAMSKCVEFDKKAKSQSERLEYYESIKDSINLSKPESLEFYQDSLIALKENHKFLKDNPEARRHSFELTYAKKAVNECEKNIELAIKLWG